MFIRFSLFPIPILLGAGKASTDDINDILNTIKSSDSKSGSDLEDILLSFVKSKSKTSGLSSVLGLLKKQGDAGEFCFTYTFLFDALQILERGSFVA